VNQLRKQRWLGVSAALVSLTLVLAACSTPGTSAGGSPAESAGGSAGPSVHSDLKIGVVTDVGPVNDKHFNEYTYVGA
jgi:basic membrane protein A